MRYIFVLWFFVILSGCSSDDPRGGLRLIAEWEPQQEYFVGFRSLEMDSAYDFVTLQIIKALSSSTDVSLLIEDSTLLPPDKKLLADQGVDTTRVHFLVESPTYFWIRDPGPIFLRKPDGKLGIADFRFNYYTNLHPDSIPEEDIPLDQYDTRFASSHQLSVVHSSLVMEGGGFETNGAGTAILVESVVLHRNSGKTKLEIENELAELFNIRTVIWLPEGLAEDPYYMEHLYDDFFGFGTGGHSDEFVRFVNDTTIFLSWMADEVDSLYPLRIINQERMEINFNILSAAKDWRGKSFTIVKIPQPILFYKTEWLDEETRVFLAETHPELELQNGQPIRIIACTGYLNYLISDSVVLLPEYWDPSVPEIQKDRDQEVENIFQSWYPNRRIIRVNPLQLNYAGGGMHCIAFGLPK